MNALMETFDVLATEYNINFQWDSIYTVPYYYASGDTVITRKFTVDSLSHKYYEFFTVFLDQYLDNCFVTNKKQRIKSIQYELLSVLDDTMCISGFDIEENIVKDCYNCTAMYYILKAQGSQGSMDNKLFATAFPEDCEDCPKDEFDFMLCNDYKNIADGWLLFFMQIADENILLEQNHPLSDTLKKILHFYNLTNHDFDPVSDNLSYQIDNNQGDTILFISILLDDGLIQLRNITLTISDTLNKTFSDVDFFTYTNGIPTTGLESFDLNLFAISDNNEIFKIIMTQNDEPLVKCCPYKYDRNFTDKLCFENMLNEFELDMNEDSCFNRKLELAEFNANVMYRQFMDSVKLAFENAYITHCLDSAKESLVKSHFDFGNHWTLYYYDRAGNLIQTVPPAGVTLMDVYNNEQLNEQINDDRKNVSELQPTHTLATQYRYNTLNQISEQYTPDGDTTLFFYDRVGRLVASQNANQRLAGNVYSYTIYDKHGRIIEVGRTAAANSISQTSLLQNISYFDTWLTSGYRTQITRTFYDVPKNETINGLFGENGQSHLRGRVTTVAFYPYDSTGYRHATHYSYDIHGHVHTLIQDYPHLEVIHQRYKYLRYFYDLVSGNVNLVIYQYSQPDQFMHHYIYDADNRITDVLTSRDSIIWDRDAAYQYYKHGPLARTQLGQHNVQGIDYAYTIQGWLKGVNSNSLNSEHDIGKDGSSADPLGFARDAFGFSLGYFGGDYVPIVSSASDFLASTANSPLSDPDHFLYNGNIGHMVTSIKAFMEDGKPQAALYKYDQLNRLAMMQTSRDFDVNNNSWANASLSADYMTSYEYDANGNILSLQRNATDQWGQREMDDLEYFYYPGTNRLEYVTDAVHDTMYYAAKTGIEDIDNQQAGNYEYDRIGNLVKDRAEGIDTILWNVYGKVSKVLRENQSEAPDLWFDYDASGQRVRKTVSRGGFEFNRQYTYYARDAQGNVMATYKRNSEISGGFDNAIYSLTNWILSHDSLGVDSTIALMQENFRNDAEFKNLYIDYLEQYYPHVLHTHAEEVTLPAFIGYDSTLAFVIFENYSSDTNHLKDILEKMFIQTSFKQNLLIKPIMNCGSTWTMLRAIIEYDEQNGHAELLNCLYNISKFDFDALYQIFMGHPPFPHFTQYDHVNDLMTLGQHMNITLWMNANLSQSLIESLLDCISFDLWWKSVHPNNAMSYHIQNELFTNIVNCASAYYAGLFIIDYMNHQSTLLENIFFSNADLTYLAYLRSVHEADEFIRRSIQMAPDMLGHVLNDHEDVSLESYLAMIGNRFGSSYMNEAFLEVLDDLVYTERYILENLYLYGSNRLGMITPNQTIYERVFTISGIDNEGNYIIDEVLEADSAVVQDTIAQRILTKKQYELSNHLGNVLVTVTDRRNPVESQTTSGEIGYYEADIASAQDYYPFGMLQPGRQGSFVGFDTTGTDTSVSVTLRFKLDSALAVNDTIFLEIHYSPPNYQEFELTFYRSGWTIQDYYADILQFQEPGISTGFSNGEIFLTFDLTTLGINCNTDVLVFGSQHLELVQTFQCDTHIVPIVETKMVAGGYRYGFNGMERDDEMKGIGNSYDFGARIYDCRLGIWLSVDPLFSKFPYLSPYVFGANNPIYFIDPDGREIYPSNTFIQSIYSETVIKIINNWENNSFTEKYLEPFIAGEKDLKLNYFSFWSNDNFNALGVAQHFFGEIGFNTNHWFSADYEEGWTSGKGHQGSKVSKIGKVTIFFHEVIHANLELGHGNEEHRLMSDPNGEIFQLFKKGLMEYAKANKIELSDDQAKGLIWYSMPESTQEFLRNEIEDFDRILNSGEDKYWDRNQNIHDDDLYERIEYKDTKYSQPLQFE